MATIIRHINDIVHDMWFELDKIIYSESAGIFIMYLSYSPGVAATKVLIIQEVVSFRIEDTEKINEYDIHAVYRNGDDTIVIKGNIPITIILCTFNSELIEVLDIQ